MTYKEKEIPYFVWQARCVQSIQEHGLYELKLESLHQRTNFSLCTQDLESCIRAAVPIQPVSEEVAACLNEMQRKGLPVFSGNVRDMGDADSSAIEANEINIKTALLLPMDNHWSLAPYESIYN